MLFRLLIGALLLRRQRHILAALDSLGDRADFLQPNAAIATKLLIGLYFGTTILTAHRYPFIADNMSLS